MLGGDVTDVGMALVEAVTGCLANDDTTSLIPHWGRDSAEHPGLARHDAPIGSVGAALLAIDAQESQL